MERYIDKIDYEFVSSFAKKYCERVFGSKCRFAVAKASDRWCVTCRVGFKSYALFHLKDFEFINMENANKELGELMWISSLYKKFGETYYSELKEMLENQLKEKQKTEKDWLEQKIYSYKLYSNQNEK